MSRGRDVQGLAPRHREQRPLMEAPLLEREGCLPAGDRLRSRKWIFLEGKFHVSDVMSAASRLLGLVVEIRKEITSAHLTCPRLMGKPL